MSGQWSDNLSESVTQSSLKHEIYITLSESGKKLIKELINQGKTESEVRKMLYSDIARYVEITNMRPVNKLF